MLNNTKKETYFERIYENAKAYVDSLSNEVQNKLKEQLCHGVGFLTKKDQLKMYLKSYGEIHRDKLLHCYEKIPYKLWYEDKLSIVDYGAGQGLAEIVLADFLKSKNIGKDIIQDITLIDPSQISLIQAVKYLNNIFMDTKIVPIQKNDVDLYEYDLHPKANTVIHILSNVIDMSEFQGDSIISLLNGDNEHNNIVICVSPYYQENNRGKKMDEFCNMLRGYRCVYKFQKHIDEWEENYSCQIRIYASLYY